MDRYHKGNRRQAAQAGAEVGRQWRQYRLAGEIIREAIFAGLERLYQVSSAIRSLGELCARYGDRAKVCMISRDVEGR
jgi:hypothetical protein